MNVFKQVEAELRKNDLQIDSYDLNRPWGGFFVIKETDAQKFADIYFEGIDIENLRVAGKLSPKILLVKPDSRLSWQYHYRRAETWRVIKGPVTVIRSMDDIERDIDSFKEGEIVILKKGERHRLVGEDGWGIVAEFWQHTNSEKPSDEDDIVRLQDDFLRV